MLSPHASTFSSANGNIQRVNKEERKAMGIDKERKRTTPPHRCRGRPGTDESTDADGRGVSMRMEEPPPCGWTARRAKRREAAPRQAVMPRRNPPSDTMITSPRPTDSSTPEVAFHKGEPFSPEFPAISTTTTTYCLLGGDTGLAPARGCSSQHGHCHRKGKW